MALAATLYTEPGDPRRKSARRKVRRESTLRDPTLRPVDVLVHDLSIDGLRLISDADLPLDSFVWIGLPGVGRVESRIVRRNGTEYGCAFLHPIGEAALAEAFRGDEVVAIPTVPVPVPVPTPRGAVEPPVERWHPALRLVFIVGASSLLWAAIVGPFLI